MEVDPEEIISSIQKEAIEHRVPLTRAGLNNLLNPDEEDDVDDEMFLETLGYEAERVEGNEQCGDQGTVQEKDDTSVSTDHEPEALAIAQSIIESLDVPEVTGRKSFCTFQRLLCNERLMPMRQTVIPERFSS